MSDPAEPLPKVEFARGYGRRFPRRGHYLINTLAGAAAFLAACCVLHAVLPEREVPEVTSKLRYFAEHKQEFDTLFIGSSRIERHVVPELFDRAAAERGMQTHSFNFGIGGMHPPESFYVLNEILRLHPPALKRVFVELEELYPPWLKEDTATLRSLYWHDWPRTWLVIRKSLDPDGHRPWYAVVGEAVRSNLVHAHLGLFLKNIANVGRGKDLVQETLIDRPNESGPFREFDLARGYNPHKQSNDDAERYSARMRKWSARRPVVDGVTDRGYRDCARDIRSAGSVPVFVVPPNPSLSELGFSDPPAPTLAFNLPEKYPALYEFGMRTDVQHLTAEGAQLFTRLLAERFVREVAPAN